MGEANHPKNFHSKVERKNKEIFEPSRGVVGVPVVVKPVVVPVPLLAVPVQIRNVEVAIRVAEMYKISSLPPSFKYFRD